MASARWSKMLRPRNIARYRLRNRMHSLSLVLWDASPSPLNPLEVLSRGMTQLPRLLMWTWTNSRSETMNFGASFLAAGAKDGAIISGAMVIA